MVEFIAAPQNLAFSVALVLMFGIAILEGITAVFGAALSGVLDSLLPDFDFDMEMDIEGHSPHALSRLLAWLRFGKVPVLILLVIFLTGFGLIGLGIQSFTQNTFGFLWPSLIASIPAVFLTLPIVRIFGGVLGAIMPKDETEVVSQDSFIGRIANITLGTAKISSPAEAKLTDEYGMTHYIMVEPDNVNDEFDKTTPVLVIKKDGHIFKVIKNENQNLVDSKE